MITSSLHYDIFYGEKHNYIKSHPQAIFKHLEKLSSWAKNHFGEIQNSGQQKVTLNIQPEEKIMEKQRFGSKIFVFCCLQ